MTKIKKCKVCGKLIGKRYRIYCSKKCRQKTSNRKNYRYQLNWARKERSKYAPGKKKCIICGGWYIQVGSHIFQSHNITCRKYRELYNLPVKRGIVPKWFRKIKGNIALKNGTWKNLLKGKEMRYKKGDPRAKETLFWKGKNYTPDEYYE